MADDRVSFIIADLDLFTRKEIIALALNVNANLRENPPIGTPVDTGWASANWVPSIGEPNYLPADNRDPGPAEIAARAKISDQGNQAVLAWQPDQGAIFSTNSVPYIGALNAGHSPQQAQPGFVGRAIEKAIKETVSRGANKAALYRRADAAGGRSTGALAFGRPRERRASK